MLDPRQFLNTEFLNMINPLPKAEQAEFVEFLSSCVNSNSFSENQISQIYNLYSKNTILFRVLMSKIMEDKFKIMKLTVI